MLLKIEKYNEALIRIVTDDRGILHEVSEHFSFYAEGYRFMPSFRNKMWDGKIRIFDYRSQVLPIGLTLELINFLRARKYDPKIDEKLIPHSYNDVSNFIDNLDLRSDAGKRIKPFDYQKKAIIDAIANEKIILVSPTGSGKSLMIYILIRFFQSINPESKVCVIVPTVGLVEQMSKDFADYSQNDIDFDAKTEIHKIYSGKEREKEGSRVVISTWQTAIKLHQSWFNEFVMVVGDEAHLFKAKSLNIIMRRFENAKFRIGTTGTLDDIQCHEWILKGHFGPPIFVAKTHKLISDGVLSKMSICVHHLKYSAEKYKKEFKTKTDYQKEIDFIVENEARMKFVYDLATKQKGNTLILFRYVEKHGKKLHEYFIKNKRKNVYFIHGGVSVDDRENVRLRVEKHNDAIITASLGTFSTGINIRNLHNIIIVSPLKSKITLLQSIGRGLRKADNQQALIVHDIIDDLTMGRKTANYTLNHGIARIEQYMKEQFPIDVKTYENIG